MDSQLTGPLKIVERFGGLSYRFELLSNMRVHNVISVAHLERTTGPAFDPYLNYHRPPPATVSEREYEVEMVVCKWYVRGGRGWSTRCLIRWEGLRREHDTRRTDGDVINTIVVHAGNL